MLCMVWIIYRQKKKEIFLQVWQITWVNCNIDMASELGNEIQKFKVIFEILVV